MSTFQRNLNLPRLEFITYDGGLRAIDNRPRSETVLIIAPALDGPNDAMVPLNNGSVLEQLYGPVLYNSQYLGPNGEVQGWSGNHLVRAVREAQAGGAQEVRVLRVGGTPAQGTLTVPASANAGVTGTVTFSGRYPGRIYNQASVVFTSGATSGKVVINQPVAKGGNVTYTWTGANSGMSVADLVDAINANRNNTTVIAAVGTASPTAFARNLTGTAALAGGTDGTDNDDLSANRYTLYNNLTADGTGSFEVIADEPVDIVYIAGIYVDDQVAAGDATKSIAVDFANWLAQRSLSYPTIGVLGVRPLTGFPSKAAVNAHYSALLNTAAGNRDTNYLNAGYFLGNGFIYADGSLEQPIDAGGYLQIVAADVTRNDSQLGAYRETAAGIYAGTLSATPPQRAATHQVVNGLFATPYLFTNKQLDALVAGVGANIITGALGGGAYVTIRQWPGQGTLFTRDVTTAQRSSDYKDLQPLRIANAVHKAVRLIAFPYLGQGLEPALLQALETQVKSYLNSLWDAHALLGKDAVGYTVSIQGGQDNPMDRLLGRIAIDITLRPALQIRQITVRVRMSL